jgi:dienelactone hydrolase
VKASRQEEGFLPVAVGRAQPVLSTIARRAISGRPRPAPDRAMIRLAAALLVALTLAGPAQAQLAEVWPDAGEVARIEGAPVGFPSTSPFVFKEIGPKVERTHAQATLYLPEGATAARPVPAVVLLHGSGGVIGAREPTYARQLAAMGVAALVIDVFGARREKWTSFIERLLAVTETMMMADAYAALDWLAARPEIDASRVAVMGFSYGGMATTYAAYAQAARALASSGRRFSAHIAFYAPCIASFDDPTTTGAPVLMVVGALDRIIDTERCEAVRQELARGGSAARLVVYDDAFHQWDGWSSAGWSPRRGLRECRLRVQRDGTVSDGNGIIEMTGFYSRATILGLCSDSEGYTIKGDAAVRARSNTLVARFLNEVWWGGQAATPLPARKG